MKVTAEMFNPTPELVIHIGIPTTEAITEVEAQTIKIQAKLSKCST